VGVVRGEGGVHMYVCIFGVGQSSKKMSAMRLRHKKLSCVLTVREKNLLKESKEVRERNISIIEGTERNKKQVVCFSARNETKRSLWHVEHGKCLVQRGY
jgi:hypothetical protein